MLLMRPLHNLKQKGNCLMMIPSQSYLSVHESLDDAVDYLTCDEDGNPDLNYCSDWEVFKSQNNVVNILEYNDPSISKLDSLNEPVTPCKINFSVRNTKYPAASAAAIGNPSSATILKKSMALTQVFDLYHFA